MDKHALDQDAWVNMAIRLNSYVHENCKEVPHNIGIHLAQIADEHYTALNDELEIVKTGYAALVNAVAEIKDVADLALLRNFTLPTEKVDEPLEKN